MTHRTAHPAHALYKRTVLAIATATGSTSLLMNVWFPFLPLFMLQVGAKDDAAALFWVAVGASSQGVGRLVGGPLWGLLSDRLGRKKMFVRAVYFAALTSFVLSIINAPWQVGSRSACRACSPGSFPRQWRSPASACRTPRSGRAERRLGRAVPGQRDRPRDRRGHGDRFGYRGAIFTSGC